MGFIKTQLDTNEQKIVKKITFSLISALHNALYTVGAAAVQSTENEKIKNR